MKEEKKLSNMIHIISESRFKALFDGGKLLNEANNAPKSRFIVKVEGYKYPYLAIDNSSGLAFHKMFLELNEAISFLVSVNAKGCEA